MKALALAILVAVPCLAQDHKLRVSLTPSSNVAAAPIGKSLDKRCAEVVITADAQKANYQLEAIDTGGGKGRKPYEFTLFNSDGDRVFSTETAALSNAVKDVCGFIQMHEK